MVKDHTLTIMVKSMKVNGRMGTKQWTNQLGTSSADAGNVVRIDSSGNI